MIPNYDPETGIHYGVIGANSIDPEAANDIYMDSLDLTASEIEIEIRERVNEFTEELTDWIPKWAMGKLVERLADEIIGTFYENYEPNEPLMRYENDEYIILYSTSSNVLIVEKSPYCTRCRMCSPCYPNAGDLDSPDMGADFWTYCLGADFFENDANPYAIMEVSRLCNQETE